ncbi:MAG: hypothetical protein FJW14_13870 [Acidimicrobiia bacterium]|nr:hypothetical protein [Acidimicrobiia bacterium]
MTRFLTVALCLLTCAAASAQRAGGPPPAAREAAAIDLTGYWVSVITEDWKYRMVTPRKGVFDALPLNPEGRKVGNAWDPARDEAAGEQCRTYGAAAIMRMPTRLNITWQDANTLRIQTDAGTQTRIFHFAGQGLPAVALAKAGEPSWQGLSVARWEYGPAGRTGGSLRVVTTNLRAGYVRRNGAPYSERATVTEHYDVNTLPNGVKWMTITTKVDDPTYFTRTYITTSDFKQLPDAAGWNPTPCAT